MAKKSIQTSIDIQASPAKVWQILTDFDKYPEWNPFLKFIKGDVQKGKIIHINANGTQFKPIVLAFEKEKELRWIGKLLFKGLFDGEHSFVIEDQKNGSVTFHHREKFNGILVGLMAKSLDTDITHAFHQMNQKLKEMAEC